MASIQVHSHEFETLKGKVAIVTGASRGLGRGIALEFARRGASIAAVFVSQSSAKKIKELSEQVERLGNSSKCIGIQADLHDSDCAQTIVRQTVAAFGSHIDVLINNAGVELVKSFSEITTSDYEHVYQVNVFAPILLVQAVKPHLRAPARIINISSSAARAGVKDLSIYCSSKAALDGLTRCWAAEFGEDGHTVNSINPGPVQSDMLDKLPKDLIERRRQETLMQSRLGTCDDIAQIAAWLASEESRWVTGQAISATGGLALY